MSIWIKSYAIFWLIYNGYNLIKYIKKLATDKKIKDERDEELIESLDTAMSSLIAATSMKFFVTLASVIIVVVISLDVLGYGLVYSYVQLEGFKQVAFYVAVLMLCVQNLIRLHDFTQILKKLDERISAADIVKKLNDYTLAERVVSAIFSISNFYFALQLLLWSLFS